MDLIANDLGHDIGLEERFMAQFYSFSSEPKLEDAVSVMSNCSMSTYETLDPEVDLIAQSLGHHFGWESLVSAAKSKEGKRALAACLENSSANESACPTPAAEADAEPAMKRPRRRSPSQHPQDGNIAIRGTAPRPSRIALLIYTPLLLLLLFCCGGLV